VATNEWCTTLEVGQKMVCFHHKFAWAGGAGCNCTKVDQQHIFKLDEGKHVVCKHNNFKSFGGPDCNCSWLDNENVKLVDLEALTRLTKRPSQAAFTEIQRFKFQKTINWLNSNEAFGPMVAYHSDSRHEMHGHLEGVERPYGVQRFLAWHRIYLRKFEEALQQLDPDFVIPYWDWSVDRGIPEWIAGFDPTVLVNGKSIVVARAPGDPAELPTTQVVGTVMASATFLDFTKRLEDVHNGVHSWFEASTMNNQGIAPADPIFWMHHANVDRLWAQWQAAHPGDFPDLPDGVNDESGRPANIMDPWTSKEADTRNTTDLKYYYAG